MKSSYLFPKLKQVISMIIIIAFMISFIVLPVSAEEDENKYYFFDTRIVEKAENVSLELGTVTKTVTQASWLDQYNWSADSSVPDWEQRVTIMYPYVLYDENGISVDGINQAKYKIWYHSWYSSSPVAGFDWRNFLIDSTNSKNIELGDFSNTAKGVVYSGGHVVCYMESNDGINWTRPNCGEFYYKTQSGEIIGTNIVYVGNHGPGVSKNEHPNAGTTEPAFLLAGQASGTGDEGIAVSWSDDGIHWEESVIIKSGNTTSTHMKADTHNQIFWSSELGRYVVISRGLTGLRTVLQMTSTDSLTSIKQMATVKASASSASYWTETGSYWTDPEIVLSGTNSSQPYSVPVLHASDGYYIGIVSVANFDSSVSNPVYQSVHAELVWSPDATNWYYINSGEPFIDNADSFELKSGNDYGMIYSAAPVVTSEGTQFFYAAVPELHYFSFDQIPSEIKTVMETEYSAAYNSQAITRTTTMNVATIANDHYAGYSGSNGSVSTKGFYVSGKQIKITADVASGGSLTAALLDFDGNAITGFGHEDCTAITANVSDNVLEWTGDEASLIGKTVSIEFRLNNATLYTVSGNIAATELVALEPSQSEYILSVGDSETLSISIVPDTAYKAAELTYTSSNTDVATVSSDGTVLGCAPGKTTITVTTNDKKYSCEISVTVVSADAPVWSVGFEDGLLSTDWTRIKDDSSWVNASSGYSTLTNTKTVETDNAHSGSYVFQNANSKIAILEKVLDEKSQQVVSVWFYDDGTSTESDTYVKVLSDSKPLVGIGLKSSASTTHYSYLYFQNQYITTQVARSKGWHLFTFDFTNSYPELYIDCCKVATLSGTPEGSTSFPMTSFNKIWLGWFTGSNSGCYFDDVAIANAKSTVAHTDSDNNNLCDICGESMATATESGYVASLNCADTELNVDEQLTVTVHVTGSGYTDFASGEVILAYDSTKLAFNESASTLNGATVSTQTTGTVKLEDYGETQSFGNAYTLVFDAKAEGSAEVKLTSAAFSTQASAESSDLVAATLSDATINVTLTQMYSVTLPEIFAGNASVKKGNGYQFKLADDAGYYNYGAITATMDGQAATVVDNGDGSYTIKNVTGALVISGTRTGKTYKVTLAGSAKDDVTLPADKPQYGVDYTFTLPTIGGYTVTLTGITYDANSAKVSCTVTEGTVKILGTDITGDFTVTVDKSLIPATDATVTVDSNAFSEVTAPPSVTAGSDLTFTVTKSDNYDYSVTATVNGNAVDVTPGENGTYTISATCFKAGDAIVIKVTKSVKTDKVTVSSYITLDSKQMWLVTVNTEKLSEGVFAYKESKMYWSEKYNAYCYLMISAEAAPTVAADDLAIIQGTADTVDYGMDVNLSGKVDANDAQLVYNMYKAEYSDFTENVTVEKFLRADVNGDKTVNVSDATAIINAILKTN